jgi:photosystem II stability/assembly factor-like uncharacterized protein
VDDSGNIYAGKQANLYKSIDGGVSWSQIYTIPGTPTQTRRVFCDSRNYVFVSGYASTIPGLYRSVNGAGSFTKVITMDADCCVWGMDEDASGNLYVGEYSRAGAGSMRMWKSTDGGENWVEKYSNERGGASADHVHDVRVDPNTGYGTYVYVGTDVSSNNKIYRFTDNGGASVTLNEVYDYPEGSDVQVYCAGESGNKVFFGTWERAQIATIIQSSNGTDWTVAYSDPNTDGSSGYWAVSRHARSGVFYFNHGNDYGIKYTP